MYYYGQRFYDPNLQRWLNRDPINEDGDFNLFRFAMNASTCYLDAYGLDPGDKFPSLNDAGKDACKYIYPKTKKDKVEYGAYIVQNPDGTFSYGEPRKGDKDSVDMGPKPDKSVGMFHSHPIYEEFSGEPKGFFNFFGRRVGVGDTFNADGLGIPSFLVTPSGNIKRYDPSPKKDGNGPITNLGTVR